jgi:CRP-like cAMP-binding protein
MIAYLPAWSKRVRTLLDWAVVPFFGRDVTSVNAASDHMGVQRELYEPGQPIIREGDVGRSMYLIQSGSVEVVRATANGGEERLAVLSAGEHFGEVAVLQDVRRTATVRALEPLAVLRISRDQTRQLSSTFKPFAEMANARMNPAARP